MVAKTRNKPASTTKSAPSNSMQTRLGATAILEKPQEEGIAVAPTPIEEKTPTWEPELDDYVCCLRRNWGDAKLCPPDLVDYMDGFTFTGGVARNVPYEQVKKWLKRGLINRNHVFPNNVKVDAFVKATGRSPQSPENVAAAMHTLTPDKWVAILGDEAALKLANEVKKLVSSRNKEEF